MGERTTIHIFGRDTPVEFDDPGDDPATGVREPVRPLPGHDEAEAEPQAEAEPGDLAADGQPGSPR